MDLKEKARQLPEKPGVYIMKDFEGNIIYIGKAKILKNRVSQYFQNSKNRMPKIERLIEGIRDFDYLLADTELEALLLECRLIKDLKPIYNSQLKNHQKYVYIKIDLQQQFPRLELAAVKEEQGTYFGPYASTGIVETAIAAINDSLRLRHCSSITGKSSGCLNFQLGLCLAPCTGNISEQEYRELIEEAVAFIKGEKKDLKKQLKSKMLTAAESLDFIKAAKYRDAIKAIGHLAGRQNTISFSGSSKTILALEKIEDSSYKLFIVKGSRVIYKERLDISADKRVLKQHILDVIYSYKKELLKNEGTQLEKEDIDQAQILYYYLKNKKECSYALIHRSYLNQKEEQKLQLLVEQFLDDIINKSNE